jgi:predicted DNA-binding protein
VRGWVPLNPAGARARIVPVENETQVSIRLEEELVAEAEAIAKNTGLKRAAILRMAIVKGLPAVKEKFAELLSSKPGKSRTPR